MKLEVRIVKELRAQISQVRIVKDLVAPRSSGQASGEWAMPEGEELIYTPVVFVRVANTGVTGYGEWKSA
jgi:hypothetical protein